MEETNEPQWIKNLQTPVFDKARQHEIIDSEDLDPEIESLIAENIDELVDIPERVEGTNEPQRYALNPEAKIYKIESKWRIRLPKRSFDDEVRSRYATVINDDRDYVKDSLFVSVSESDRVVVSSEQAEQVEQIIEKVYYLGVTSGRGEALWPEQERFIDEAEFMDAVFGVLGLELPKEQQ